MPNGRCKLHGGASTGAPEKNTNALKHGGYGTKLTPEEEAIFEGITLGSVDDELRLARIRLRRLLDAEHAANGTPEVEEIIEREGGGEMVADREIKRRTRDYHTLIDKQMGRIESLEKTRAGLLAAQGGGGNLADEITRDDTTIAPDEPTPDKPIL